MDEEPPPQGSSPLFAVFFLSIYSLFVIPYTIYKLCHAASPDEVVKPWELVRSYSFCNRAEPAASSDPNLLCRTAALLCHTQKWRSLCI